MRTTKFAALFAAVALLVVGAAFASFAGWVPEGDDWTYYNAKDEQVFEEWQQYNGNWFWLDESGFMAKDELINWKDNYYYVDANGMMVANGWIKITDDVYDVNDDDVDYRWFYFGADGKAYKNAMKECNTAAGTKTFIFNANAEMLYNYVTKDASNTSDKYSMTTDFATWAESEDATCYWCGSADDGAVVMGNWVSLKVKEDDNGDDENAWFYCQASGKIVKAAEDTKALTIGGVQYTFDTYGKMISGWATEATATSANYYTDKESGARVTKGWFQAYAQDKDADPDEEEDTVNWYYAKKKNLLAKDEILSVGGKWYAFDSTCAMVSGLYDATISADKKFNAVAACGDMSASDFEKLLETREDGESALYYFNEVHDGTFGSLKTGTHKVTIDDEDYTLSFKSAKNFANNNGRALNGIDGNYYYQNGQKVTFDSEDNRYWILDAKVDTDESKAVNAITLDDAGIKGATVAAKICGSKDKVEGITGKIVMTASGSFCKSLTNKTDTDGYKLTVVKYQLTTIVNGNK